jgi:anti-sigma regulatory factor (Ser/Thr protein kinase)
MSEKRGSQVDGQAMASVDLELESSPEAAAVARMALDGLAGRVAARRLRDLRLLVSELVTNAVRHAGLARSDRIRLLVDVGEGFVHVEVHDPGRGFEPTAPSPDPARASGWGLYLVEELADRWGVDGVGRGTRVWFELDGPRRN